MISMRGRDSGWGGRYTINPLRSGYGWVRLHVGERLSDYMVKHDLTEGRWRPLAEWAWGSEGAYNCIILPTLGGVIRWETRHTRALHKAVAYQRAGDNQRAKKYFEKGWRCEDKKDVYKKKIHPDHQTRLERLAESERLLQEIIAKHRPLDNDDPKD